MRDYRRIKRKVDISLDKRQVLTIFSGLFVGAVLTFSLGLVIGRHSAAPAEARLQNLSENEEAPVEKLDLPEPLELVNPVDSPANQVMVGLSEPAEVQAKEKKPLDPRKSKSIPDEQKKGKRSSDKPRAVSSNEPVEEETNLNGKRYTVQLNAYKTANEAKAFMKSLKSKNVDCRLETSEKDGQVIWYRVRSGSFGSELEAKLYIAQLNRLGINEAWVAKAE